MALQTGTAACLTARLRYEILVVSYDTPFPCSNIGFCIVGLSIDGYFGRIGCSLYSVNLIWVHNHTDILPVLLLYLG